MELDSIRKKRGALEKRAALFASLRRSFDAAGFLEVETDLMIEAPAPEEYIESIPAGTKFLRASPEIAMKIMLAAGYERIYQIGRCFRAGEHGSRHREEFTMLEFYAAGFDYRELADLTCNLIRDAAIALSGKPETTFRGRPVDLGAEPEVITVEDAFRRYCEISMDEADERDLFDELMVTKIEPRLGLDRLAILTDYPANRASLARLSPANPRVAERWELYIGGLELANAYGELLDPAEQRARFEATLRFRAARGMLSYPVANDFFAALAAGLPQCSGCALGLDRLAMVFTDAADIAQVRAE